jgi:hypothetical protein
MRKSSPTPLAYVLGAVVLIVIVVVLVLALGGGSSCKGAKCSTSKGSGFKAALTITATSSAGKASSVSLTCSGQTASAAGVEAGSPATACATVQKDASVLSSSSSCSGGQTATITGKIGSSDVKSTIRSCDKAAFAKALPLLPVAAINPSSLPPTTRNGLLFISQKKELIAELTQPTSKTIEKEILGQKVTISCTTSSGKWSQTLVWPASAPQIVTHPTGTPKQCQFIVKGHQVLAEATL